MDKDIILKADSFNFPSKKERIKISREIPTLKMFQVKYKSAFFNIINRTKEHEDAIIEEDIFWWNDCLNNRIWWLTESYTFAITHFNRYQINKELLTDKLLFEFFLENFYYYYFSTRDILAQLLNLIFRLNPTSEKIHFNQNFINKISNSRVKNHLQTFYEETYSKYETRNAFTHRFTPILIDNRASTNIKKEGNKTGFNNAKQIDYQIFVDEIEIMMNSLEKLLNNINTEINQI